jgi:hypothetical protein
MVKQKETVSSIVFAREKEYLEKARAWSLSSPSSEEIPEFTNLRASSFNLSFDSKGTAVHAFDASSCPNSQSHAE